MCLYDMSRLVKNNKKDTKKESTPPKEVPIGPGSQIRLQSKNGNLNSRAVLHELDIAEIGEPFAAHRIARRVDAGVKIVSGQILNRVVVFAAGKPPDRDASRLAIVRACRRSGGSAGRRNERRALSPLCPRRRRTAER